jgi:phospholipase/carboxylesterase
MAHNYSLRMTPDSHPVAHKALVLVHGRGGSADDMLLNLAPHLYTEDFRVVAPQATHNTWYPYSFMMPPAQNEPWLSSALAVLERAQKELNDDGILSQNIYWLGFSQGACLTLEYTARHAQRYGGVFALSGGLIGDHLETKHYQGSWHATPILLGCSDRDPHIPLSRVEESSAWLVEQGADVIKRIYPNMPHTIIQDEIEIVNTTLKSNPL